MASSITVTTSPAGLEDFIDSIPPSATLYLDLEGNSLSRNGTVSIITILVNPTKITRLIDIQTLGSAVFTTPAANGKTLKTVLEDPHISKCLWDVRNDADALCAHYKARIAGVTDIQLLENAAHIGDKKYVRGLGICVENDLDLELSESNSWNWTKRRVMNLMTQNIFAKRPLDPESAKYCFNDVVHRPALYRTYLQRSG
jgi:exonuclease 3'-5' domain-containing protein 1